MPRLYREAPLMGIWEAPGNVSALDTLRAMATRPECVEVLFDELAQTPGHDPAWTPDAAAAHSLADLETIEYRARKQSPRTSALVLQGRCWCATAIRRWPRRSWPPGRPVGGAFGTLPTGWTWRRSSSAPW